MSGDLTSHVSDAAPAPTDGIDAVGASCCPTRTQSTCCDASEKPRCCGAEAAAGDCGCQ